MKESRKDERAMTRQQEGSVTTANAAETEDDRSTPAYPGIGGGTPGGGRPGEGDVSGDSVPKRPR